MEIESIEEYFHNEDHDGKVKAVAQESDMRQIGRETENIIENWIFLGHIRVHSGTYGHIPYIIYRISCTGGDRLNLIVEFRDGYAVFELQGN